jgi:hypothetical protein
MEEGWWSLGASMVVGIVEMTSVGGLLITGRVGVRLMRRLLSVWGIGVGLLCR